MHDFFNLIGEVSNSVIDYPSKELTKESIFVFLCIRVQVEEGDKTFDKYPELGIEEWHKKNKCYID